MTVQRLKLAGVAIGCFAFLAAAPGVALAASECDAGITKAAGKKEGCLCGVYAKSQAKNLAPDPTKLQKCKDKFAASCAKAQSAAAGSSRSSPRSRAKWLCVPNGTHTNAAPRSSAALAPWRPPMDVSDSDIITDSSAR